MARCKQQLELRLRTWGGKRDGAGRKPTPGRRRVPHRPRVLHQRHCPAHVTLRASSAVPSLRTRPLLLAARTALAAASTSRFRVLQYSVQADHLHLLVEADGPTGFERGVQGLAIRVAKAVNRALGRTGRVWGDRYHARMLRTPREVRHALVYMLNNFKKHFRGARGLDPCSSARWFDGWRIATGPGVEASPVARACTWLARVGWRRHGLIDVDEHPRLAHSG
jgi:putative transposase